ncbi:MAG: MFS transporter [Tumebacillaceae bacterium]
MSKPFSYGKILAIGSGFFAISVVWMVYNTFMPLILSQFIEGASWRGAIMGLDNLLAMLLIPVIGTWSDRTNTKYGQRLPFIAVGMPLAALLFFTLPNMQGSMWTLLAVDILFLLAMTVVRGPVIALMPDYTPPEKRSTANGLINLMGGIGSLIALFAVAKTYDANQAYPFAIAGSLMLLCFFLLFFVVDRKPAFAASVLEESDEVAARRSLGSGLKQLFAKENRSRLLVLIAIFFYFIGYAGVEAQFSTYATESLGLTGGQAGTTLGFFSLSFVLFALPAGLVGSKLGKMRTMTFGLVLLPVVFLIVPFLHSMWTLRIVLLLGGIGWALINVQAYPLVAGFGGKTQIGFFTGMYYLFSMLSQSLAPFLLGVVMDTVSQPAMFYAASASMFIALLLLRQGAKGVRE